MVLQVLLDRDSLYVKIHNVLYISRVKTQYRDGCHTRLKKACYEKDHFRLPESHGTGQ